jgi:HlyD family secretion protein
MEKKLYRQVSLDRLSSPEQIDHLLQVTTARGWIALLTFCGTLVAALIWGFTGSTDTTVLGQGVIAHAAGVDTVVALAGGTVLDITVHVGDAVKAGQVVAHVAQPALTEKVKQAKLEIDEAQRTRQRLLASRGSGNAIKLQAMTKQIASYERDITDTTEQIRLAKEQLPVDEQLLAKGLITKQTAIANMQKVVTLESNIQKYGAQIAQVQADQFSMSTETNQFDLDLTNKINGLQRNLNVLQQDLERTSRVVSRDDGRIVEIASYQGAMVNAGQPILSVEPQAGNLEGFVYILASQVKEITKGMEVHISPSGVQREEHGYMLGTVSSVAGFPATMEAVLRTFENETLARSMMRDGPVTELYVSLFKNQATASGYTWSSPKGPPTKITSGTVCSVEVVTRRQRPIELVLPYMKRTLGLE